MNSKANYIGRFAPSPSGPLNFGYLVAALASYLDARAHGGNWLLRMEDLDPAREPPEAASQILRALELFGLHWDGPVLYQSQRLDAYTDAFDTLRARGLVYACDCSRQQIQAIGGVYDNRCRSRTPPLREGSWRLQVDGIIGFADLIQGEQSQNLLLECGDFTLLRKDGLFAYQLAVVVDDGYQRITDIVRGWDLLESTPRQIYLQQLLGLPTPQYAHIPVAVNDEGQKLSKQHFAAPLPVDRPARELTRALAFLGQKPEAGLQDASASEVLTWATQRWDIQAVSKLANIRLDIFY